nr:hypothetical protein [Tanacetum cinerariifolium]
MWTSLGVVGSVGVVNVVRCVFVDLPRKVGLQVALPAPSPSTMTLEAACHHLVVVLLEDNEALNNVPMRDREAFINSLWCFAGARGGCGGDLEQGGEIVNRSGDLKLGSRNVIHAVGENVIRGGVFELGGRNVIRGDENVIRDGDLEQDDENVIGDGDGVGGGNNVNHPCEQDGGAISIPLI